MAQAVPERRPVEQRRGQHVHGVEPAPRLPDVLHDEVARVVVLEPVLVLERVVHLRERHRAGLEPAVQHLGDAPHRRLPGRVVRVRPGQLVDVGPVQVGDLDAEVTGQLLVGPVDVHPRILRVVRLPHRDRRAPEPVPGDRPVPRVRQPLAERAVLDVRRRPGDLLVQLDHPVPELRHRHEPRGHSLVDERRVAAPAVRVGVRVAVVPEHHAALLEAGDHRLVRVEDLDALEVRDQRGEPGPLVDGDHGRDAGGVAGVLVVLTERRGHVDDAGTVLGGHEVRAEHLEGVLPGGLHQVVEERRVPAPDQFAALDRADLLVPLQLLGVGGNPARSEDDFLPGFIGQNGIFDVRPHGERQVRRQGPGRRRPDRDPLAGLQLEENGQRRIGPVPVDVVHPRLGVRQRRLTAEAVGENAETLVHQSLVEKGLERPHDRLHVTGVERLVVVVEIDPAGLPGDVLLPFPGIGEHGCPAGLVELVDAEVEDLRLAGDAELLLGLDLRRHAVRVPAETALDALSAHRPVPRDDVLHIAGEEMPVVRKAVRERRAVVEDVFVAAVLAGRPGLDRGLESAIRRPVLQDGTFHRGQIRRGRNARRAGVLGIHLVLLEQSFR